MEQVIDVKINPIVRPKPPSATSIPAILKSLQDVWDACMLTTFTLQQQLDTTRHKLSHALYQHDAACRVIARLTKEATVAREALATLKPQSTVGQPMVIAPQQAQPEKDDDGKPIGLTEAVIQKLQDKASVLTAERKKRGKKTWWDQMIFAIIDQLHLTLVFILLPLLEYFVLTCVHQTPTRSSLVELTKLLLFLIRNQSK